MQSDPVHDPQTSNWHLDKRLPVALIIALLAQAGSSLWWAASFSARTETRLDSAEKRLALGEDVARKLADTQQQIAMQVAINAETQKVLSALATKLEVRLENLSRQPPSGGPR